MGIQDKIAKGLFTAKRKFYDIEISMIGTEHKFIAITVTEDKYEDREYTITNNRDVTGYIDFPDNEVPIEPFGSSNQNSKTLPLYDLLPIRAWFKFEDAIKKEEILLYKVQLDPENFYILPLEVVNMLGKVDRGLVWIAYELAPYTLSLINEPEVQTIINTYLAEDWI